MFVLCDSEATVSEKSSTQETIYPLWMLRSKEATWVRNCIGEIGDPYGVPTDTAAGVLGEP